MMTGLERSSAIACASLSGVCLSVAFTLVTRGKALDSWDTEHLVWLALLLAVGAVPGVVLAVTGVRWLHFLRWRRRFPFAVEGDLELLATDPEGSDYWRETVVTVDLAPARDGEAAGRSRARAIKVLRVFAERTRRHAYALERGCGTITPWTVSQGVDARGEANCRVAWTLYRFLARELAAEVRAGLTVARVTVRAGPLQHRSPATQTD